jgi:hypothetical protein
MALEKFNNAGRKKSEKRKKLELPFCDDKVLCADVVDFVDGTSIYAEMVRQCYFHVHIV